MSSASQLLFGHTQGISSSTSTETETLYFDLAIVATDAGGDLSSGITITVPNASDTIIITKPLGLTYQAWSNWATDGEGPGGNAWRNAFSVTTSDNTTTSYNTTFYNTPEEAEDNFETVALSGSTLYTIWLNDPDNSDNRGGLSLKIERVFKKSEILPFSFLDVFNYTIKGIWADPSDMGTMFQDLSATTPVVSDGDFVSLMLDKSGNGNHLYQAISSSRPAYRTDGTFHWLEFDGIDDFLQTEDISSTLTDSAGLMAAAWETSEEDFVGGLIEEVGPTASNRMVLYGDTSSVKRLSNYAVAGTSNLIFKASEALINTPYVYLANSDGSNIESFANGASEGIASSSDNFASSPTKITIGKQTSGEVYFSGKFFGGVVSDNAQSSENVDNINSILSEKSGATLV